MAAPRPHTPAHPATRTSRAVTLVPTGPNRSEEHTSELQSQSNLVFRLLLEKKKIHAPPQCRESFSAIFAHIIVLVVFIADLFSKPVRFMAPGQLHLPSTCYIGLVVYYRLPF